MKKISKKAFDEILIEDIMRGREKSILEVPGVYQLLHDYYEDEIVQRWEEENS